MLRGHGERCSRSSARELAPQGLDAPTAAAATLVDGLLVAVPDPGDAAFVEDPFAGGGSHGRSISVDEYAKAHPPHYYWEEVRLKEARAVVEHAANLRQPNALADAQRKLSELLFPKQH